MRTCPTGPSRFPNILGFSATLAARRRRPAISAAASSEPSGDSVADQIRTGAEHESDQGDKPCTERAAPAALDPSEILVSTGAVPYAWDLATDALAWGANAREVLEVPDTALIASGAAYARMVDHRDGRSRADAVMSSGMKDEGSGIPTRCNTRSSRRRIRRRCTGSRIQAAGLRAPMGRPRAPTALSA